MWPYRRTSTACARSRRPRATRKRGLSGISSSASRKIAAGTISTQNIQRHVACPEIEVSGSTVREALEAVFAENPQARGYVLDDQAGELVTPRGIDIQPIGDVAQTCHQMPR